MATQLLGGAFQARPIRRAVRGSRGAAILRRCGAELGRPEGRCRRAAPGAAACCRLLPLVGRCGGCSGRLAWSFRGGGREALAPRAVAGVSSGGDCPRRVSRTQPWRERGSRPVPPSPLICIFLPGNAGTRSSDSCYPPASQAHRGHGSVFLPGEPCWALSHPG